MRLFQILFCAQLVLPVTFAFAADDCGDGLQPLRQMQQELLKAHDKFEERLSLAQALGLSMKAPSRQIEDVRYMTKRALQEFDQLEKSGNLNQTTWLKGLWMMEARSLIQALDTVDELRVHDGAKVNLPKGGPRARETFNHFDDDLGPDWDLR